MVTEFLTYESYKPSLPIGTLFLCKNIVKFILEETNTGNESVMLVNNIEMAQSL